MSALALAYAVMTILVALALLEAMQGRGYSCPACGTTNAREHSKDCAWKRFYEEDDDE